MAEARSIALPLELRSLLADLSTAQVADDQQWILRLLRAHGAVVVTMLWRMLGSEADVLDAYQTAVCQLTARGPDAAHANPGAYFYRIAMNAGIGILRNRRMQRQQWPAVVDAQLRRDAARTDGLSGEAIVSQRQMMDRMREAIFRLPPHLRDVVILRDLGALPYSAVADTLGIRSGTARLYRRQAVLRLAALMAEGPRTAEGQG